MLAKDGVKSPLCWKTVPVEDRMIYVLQTSSGLKKVHSRDILHRDLKPQNLMVSEDKDKKKMIKIGDFGGTKD